MQIIYKGYTLEVSREDSLGGENLLYWSIYNGSEEIDCNFTSGSETVPKFMRYLRERIDCEVSEGTLPNLEIGENDNG